MAKRKPARGRTTLAGVGHRHRQQVAQLKRLHIEGTKCWWCGRGMWNADPSLNHDGLPLSGDHTLARSRGGILADRLLHSTCNSARGDGDRDDQRPAITGKSLDQPELVDLGIRAMAWPDR